jgi:hypothetical protein
VEVGAGVVGEQHMDEAKLVALSAGPGMTGGAGSTVRLDVDATAVLQRHIAAVQLDARTRPL